MTDNEVVVYDERPLTAADVRVQVNLIQEVMKGVMQKGQHYGVVPGCGDKPTLLKPGAEKLMATFRLSADPEVEDLSSNDVLRYRVKCKLLSQSGSFKGAGIGECSSEEDKYKWRRMVSEAEWNATPETHRRIKYRYDKEEKQIRTNPYDLANTILKMAKKRSLVDAVLTVTAASDIFTQDIEDMPEEVLNQRGKPPIAPPQAKQAETKAAGQAQADASGPKASDKQVNAIYAMYGKLGTKDKDDVKQAVSEFLGFDMVPEHLHDLTIKEASSVIEYLNAELKD